MTIVATFRFGDKAVYCTDFRTTWSDASRNFIQTDEAMKFIPIGTRMGLFLAGNVDYWKRIAGQIKNIVDEVTHDNLLQITGPLKEAIEPWVYTEDSKVCFAIGVFIDEPKELNRQFTIEICPRRYSLIEEVPDMQCVVLGTGRAIPQIEQHIGQVMRKFTDNEPADLFEMAMVMENEIKCSILKCGSGAFARLGISPIMAKAYLASSYFCLPATESEDFDISASGMRMFNYSFGKDADAGLVLTDHVTGRSQEVKELANLDSLNGDRFDPLGFEQKEDPADLFPEAEWAYRFDQWAIPSCELNVGPLLYRKVSRIDFLSEYRLGHEISLAEDIVSIDNFSSAKSVDGHFFTIESLVESQMFECGLSNDRIWDDEWLSKFIGDFADLMDSD